MAFLFVNVYTLNIYRFMKKLYKWYYQFKWWLFRIITRKMVTHKIVEWQIRFGYKNPKLEPVQCVFCGNTEFYDKIIGVLEGQVCEYEIVCKQCDKTNGYWAYGNFNL